MSLSLCERWALALAKLDASPVRTVRRLDAEAGVSLVKRRTWYAPDDPPLGEGDKPDPATPPEKPEEIPDWVKDPAKAYAEIQKVRGEAAEHRKKASDAQKLIDDAAVARKVAEDKELADQNKFKDLWEKSEIEKKAALEKAQSAELKALRATVAVKNGLPDELAARLQGTTEEELQADAEKLKAFIPAGQQPAPGGRTTTTTTVPGGRPAQETDEQRRARLFG